jgi:TonB family protein
MTGERYSGYIFSFLLHSVLAAVVLMNPFSDIKRSGPIAIDFTIIASNDKYLAGNEFRPNSPGKTRKNEKTSRSGTLNRVTDNERNVSRESEADKEVGRMDSEPQGPVQRTGDTSAHRNVSSAPSGGGPGDFRTLNYARPGGVDERHFSFVRETIMQGIVYPERARRMGWEGKVVLSFVVRENGFIDDVKVISSSGFSVLDENARDTIAKTHLKNKVPVRLYVLLPVEYRLNEKRQ